MCVKIKFLLKIDQKGILFVLRVKGGLIMHNTEKPLYSVERVMHSYGDMLFRLCIATLANRQDAEDVLQDVMIKYMEKIRPSEMPNTKKHGLSL